MFWRVALVCLIFVGPSWAVEPGEVLDDPVLEQRARTLSQGLRCLVCRNESIDESNADLARDLRLLVRERLVAGDSDEAAMAFIVARYGEYVLLEPTRSGSNLILWLAGPAMLVAALGIAGLYFRRRQIGNGATDAALSPEEQDRLERILKR